MRTQHWIAAVALLTLPAAANAQDTGVGAGPAETDYGRSLRARNGVTQPWDAVINRERAERARERARQANTTLPAGPARGAETTPSAPAARETRGMRGALLGEARGERETAPATEAPRRVYRPRTRLRTAPPASAGRRTNEAPRSGFLPNPTAPSTPGFPEGSFDKLWRAYPRGSVEHVKALIGGGVDGDWVKNTCAIRISHALNQAGHAIERRRRHRDGSKMPTTYGRDKGRYIFRVKDMAKYLGQKYGRPSVIREGTGGVPFEFVGRKGIILFDVPGWSDATGHVDLWDGSKAAGSEYFSKARKIYFWPLS